LAKFAVVEEWIGVAACGFHTRGGEIFFTGAVVNYTSVRSDLHEFCGKVRRSVLAGQHLERQPPPGLNTNITVNACCDEIGTHSLTIGFVYLQLYWAYRGLCARPHRQFAILIGDVSGARGHAIGVEDWHSKFTDGFGREADSFGDPSQEWEECGFPEALIVDGGIPALGAYFRDGFGGRLRDCGNRPARFGWRGPLLATRFTQRGCVSQMISARGNELRKPETAGNVWTISPREPRRTARKRGSDMRGLADGVEKRARGMAFRVADDGHADAEAGRDGSLGDGLGGVVGAFGVDVWTEFFEEFFDVEFGENYDVVHCADSSNEKGAGACSSRMGRPGPLRRRALESELTATTRMSPSAFAPAR